MAGAGVRASQATNGKAIAALVAGICGVTIIPVACPPLALALGYQARREIAASHGRQAGRGLAVAGIVLGWAGVALAVLIVVAVSARAADLGTRTLSDAGQVVTWQGASADPTGQGYGPPAEQSCTSDTCDTLTLKVDLPAGTFPKAPRSPAPDGDTRVQAEGATDMPGDGVLITIRWATDFDQWNLYVDDMSTGQTVAQGLDVDSNAQSVLLSRPHNGLYRIRAVPVYTDFDKRDLKYSGSAAVFHDPTQRAGDVPLLPQLQTVAPSNFHIGDVPPVPSNPTGWRFTPDGTFDNSCYTDETQQFGSTRCLRFDNDIRNLGAGPLVLKFNFTPDAFQGHCDMEQEVLSGDGGMSERNAGPCVFHTQHGHFHYQNFARYYLYAVGADGMPGAAPVTTSNKVGFCTIDVDDFGLQRPRTYSFPTCNVPNAYGPGVPEFMGISPGWGDIYTWDLPQQYLDISHGVGDGVYELVSRANPDGALLTADRGQETGVTCIRITGNEVAVLHELPSQPNAEALPPCDGRRPVASSAKPRHHRARHHRHRRRHKRHRHARRR